MLGLIGEAVWKCKTVIVPLVVRMLGMVYFQLIGRKEQAQMCENVGMLLIVLLNVGYLFFLHARSQWPKDCRLERLAKRLTFIH